MNDELEHADADELQAHLEAVQELLAKHRLVEDLVHRQEMPRHDLVEDLVHKQHLGQLHARLDKMPPADIAYLLEALPLDDRLLVWDLVRAVRSPLDAEQRGALHELADRLEVRRILIALAGEVERG